MKIGKIIDIARKSFSHEISVISAEIIGFEKYSEDEISRFIDNLAKHKIIIEMCENGGIKLSSDIVSVKIWIDGWLKISIVNK